MARPRRSRPKAGEGTHSLPEFALERTPIGGNPFPYPKRVRTASAAGRTGTLVALAIGYLIAALWQIGAASRDLAGSLPGWVGDNFYFLWQNIWVRQSFPTGRSPLYVPSLFYPEGFYLARDDMTLLNTIPAALLGGLVGDVLAYNIVLIVGSVLAGLMMALWVQRLSGSLAAGSVAGLAYILLPFRSIRLAGHFDLVTLWPIPLTLLLIDRALDSGRWRDWAFAGLGFAATALGAWYFAPAFALVLPFYVAARLRSPGRMLEGRFWRGVLTFVAASCVLLVPAAVPYLLAAGPGVYSHPLGEAIKGSASMTDYLVPSIFHPLFGRPARDYYGTDLSAAVERAVTPGFVCIVLATSALVRRRDRRVLALAALGAAAFVWSLGPALQLAGKPVLISIPPAVGGWLGNLSPAVADYLGPVVVRSLETGTSFVPMPGVLVNLLLPFGRAVRVWARFGVFADTAVVALAGVGLAGLARARVGRAVVVLAGALILVDLATTGLPASPVAPRPIDGWLGARDDGKPIMLFPVSTATEPREVYATLDHRRTIVYGHATFPPLTFRLAKPRLSEFPNDASVNVLRSWGVGQVVVLPDDFGQEWPSISRRLASTTGLSLIERVDGSEIWRIEP